MALTGMDIFKLTPKTNCRECGFTTCLAFAMSLAAGKVEQEACPYFSDEAKAKMAEADAAPIKVVAIGEGKKAVKTGGESVLFRHDKRFENPTGLAILISDAMDDAEVDARLQRVSKLRYRRMRLVIGPELIALKCESQDADKFAGLVKKATVKSDAKLILMSEDPEIMAAGLKVCGYEKPLIYAATPENADRMAELAVEHSCPVAVKAAGLAQLEELSERVSKAGAKEIVLDSGARTIREAFEDQVHIRRAAVSKQNKALGWPTILFPCEMAGNDSMETLIAAMFIAKYGGIVVLSDALGETIFPLLLEKMELFADPQEPYKALAGLHEIGNPDRNSPVLLTSGWALTYYNLDLAVEVSGTPVYLCVEPLDEPDVMCWCHHCLRSTHRGKFVAESTARFVESCKLEENVDHKKLMISARNAEFKAELEKALPDWEIVVGPAEAAHLQGFLPGFSRELAGHRAN